MRAFGLSLLLSRRGLAEEELQQALGFTRLDFTPLYLAMRENLASRQGLLTFAHAHLREAVAKRYKGAEAGQRTRLISYWQARGALCVQLCVSHLVVECYVPYNVYFVACITTLISRTLRAPRVPSARRAHARRTSCPCC